MIRDWAKLPTGTAYLHSVERANPIRHAKMDELRALQRVLSWAVLRMRALEEAVREKRFKAEIEIARSRDEVWRAFADPLGWRTWYGGELRRVTPGWEEGAELDWALGPPSRIGECTPVSKVVLIGQVHATRDTFWFRDRWGDPSRAMVAYERDYSGSTLDVTDPAAVQSQCDATVVKLKRYIEVLRG